MPAPILRCAAPSMPQSHGFAHLRMGAVAQMPHARREIVRSDEQAVHAVDCLFIGPNDLAASMGHLGNSAHPEVRGAIDAAIARIRATGKCAGILASVEADARHWLALGCLFVGVGNDAGILARQTEALAAKFK